MLGRLLDDSFPMAIRRDITTVTVARLGTNSLVRFAPPFLAVIARGLDVSIGELGIALTIAELCGLSAPLIGRFVDRVPRRRSMTIGLGGVTAGAIIVAVSHHIVLFAAGLIVLSLSKIVSDVGQGAWITDHVAFERRSRVVGLTETSWALGMLVGVSSMGLVTAVASWSWAYAVGAGAVGLMIVVVWRRLGPDPVDGPGPSTAPPTGPVRLPRVGWLAVLAVTAMAGASQSLFVTFGAWLEDDRGFETAAIAGVTFGLGGLELLATTLSTARTDRWGKDRSVIRGALVMVTAAAGFVAFNDWLPAALVLLGLFIASFEFCIVSMIPIGGDLVPGRPGAGLGRLLTATTLGRAVTTIPATLMLDHWGVTTCAALGGTLAAMVAALMAARHRLMMAPSIVSG